MTSPDPRNSSPPHNPEPPKISPEEEQTRLQDERLDEELAETFPASDPIPARHDPFSRLPSRAKQ